jgi:hypothetical protein
MKQRKADKVSHETNSVQIINRSKLTTQENRVLSHLVKAWNDYCKLPKQHPSDMDEYLKAIHNAQQIIAIRGIRKLQRNNE